MADSITQFGAYHLADNPDLYEVQRSNNFEFIVDDIDGILKVGATEADGAAGVISNAQQVLRFSVVSASLPMFSQEVISIRRGNSVMKAAGIPSFTDGSLVVNDYIGADTKSALMAWQQLSYNVKTEKVGSMGTIYDNNGNIISKGYKKTCWLQEYTPDYRLVRTWKLAGCWVSALSEEGFNMEDGGKKTITATISFDKAFMELPIEE